MTTIKTTVASILMLAGCAKIPILSPSASGDDNQIVGPLAAALSSNIDKVDRVENALVDVSKQVALRDVNIDGGIMATLAGIGVLAMLQIADIRDRRKFHGKGNGNGSQAQIYESRGLYCGHDPGPAHAGFQPPKSQT